MTRTFDAPARLVFEAWIEPELFRRRWVPKSIGDSLLSCEMDVRLGCKYRLEIGHTEASPPFTFFGKYIAVTLHSRLTWTHEESDDGAVTTVTFEEKGGKTLLVFHELDPSRKALDDSIEGSAGALPVQFAQLDELLVSLGGGGS